ncbi:MAG: hypothetical protein ACUVSK_02180 [Desulfotomaculales bacterium]
MPQRLVASFLVRLIHEPGNEQIPWSITVQHIQTGRVFRLADPGAVAALFQEVVKKDACLRENIDLLEERGNFDEGGAS